ncbi:MAG: hypothetical protein ACI9EZ_001802 [Halobacteriales archaeon]
MLKLVLVVGHEIQVHPAGLKIELGLEGEFDELFAAVRMFLSTFVPLSGPHHVHFWQGRDEV